MPGKIKDQIVLVSFSDLTSKYSGISPPLKNIVNTIISRKKSLPFNRDFVSGCAEDRLKQVVCRGVLDLAKDFGARTVAKGVERREDFRAVNDMGFDQVQGLLFGKPVSAQKFARSLVASRPQDGA